MKRTAVIVIVLLCLAFALACIAAESQHFSTKQKQVLVDRNGDGKIDGVDIYDENGKVVKRGYDTNSDNFVDRWETYDSQTGLPIVTASDKAFELK